MLRHHLRERFAGFSGRTYLCFADVGGSMLDTEGPYEPSSSPEDSSPVGFGLVIASLLR